MPSRFDDLTQGEADVRARIERLPFADFLTKGQIARTSRPNGKNSSLNCDFGASRPIRFFLLETHLNSLRNLIILCVCLLETHRTGPMEDLSSEISAELMRERVPHTEDIEWFRMFLDNCGVLFPLRK